MSLKSEMHGRLMRKTLCSTQNRWFYTCANYQSIISYQYKLVGPETRRVFFFWRGGTRYLMVFYDDLRPIWLSM